MCAWSLAEALRPILHHGSVNQISVGFSVVLINIYANMSGSFVRNLWATDHVLGRSLAEPDYVEKLNVASFSWN